MTKKIIFDAIEKSIELFDSGKTQDSKIVLLNLFKIRGLNKIDQNLYDLAMELYIFLHDGDLRKQGRDFGYSNTQEIRDELEKYISTSI